MKREVTLVLEGSLFLLLAYICGKAFFVEAGHVLSMGPDVTSGTMGAFLLHGFWALLFNFITLACLLVGVSLICEAEKK